MLTKDIDHAGITEIAYRELIRQNVYWLPVDIFKFTYESIVITSFQRYSAITGVPLSDLTDHGCFQDGYVTCNPRTGKRLILYNEQGYPMRIRFTLFHELGHILLGHKQHGFREEAEADYFASQITCPDCLIQLLIERGYDVEAPLLASVFCISKQAASLKLEEYHSLPFITNTEYDDTILRQFGTYFFDRNPRRYIRASIDIVCD